MAVDFMAQQAQLPNKLIFIIALTLCSCGGAKQTPPIPDIYIWESDKNLQKKEGYLLYEGNKFSGKLIALYNEQDTASFIPFWRGKEYGRAYQKYPNGKLKEERFFRKGWKEGEHKGWWEDGKPRFTYYFKDDLYEGNLKEWYANGQLFKDFNYEKGQETGAQKAWKEDGKIKANYQIKDGRRYGLLGVKNCASVLDK
jgi:antitoxin component YwqK of YwqJK toxin-antitoxin module